MKIHELADLERQVEAVVSGKVENPELITFEMASLYDSLRDGERHLVGELACKIANGALRISPLSSLEVIFKLGEFLRSHYEKK